MPPSKTSPKSKPAQSKNQYTAELSSSQLVLGVTILMVFGLACFLLGVIVGKFDPSLRPEQQIADSSEANAVDDSGTSDGNNDPAKKTEKNPTTTAKTTKSSTTPVVQKEIVVKPKGTSKPVQPAAKIPESDSVKITDVRPIESHKVDIPKETPPKTVVTPKTTIIEKPAENIAANIAKPTAPTPASKDDWGVQVGAFKQVGSAESERKRLEAKLPFKISILKRKGDVWNRLLVGNYSTKAEAEAVKQKLIREHSMVDPFLVNRN